MRSLNPACKFTGLLAVTFVLAWRHDPVLNLIVSVLSILLILSARVKVKSLLLFMSPVLLFAVGMFFTGFYFSAGSDMPVNEKTMAFASSSFWNGLTLASRVLAFAGIGLSLIHI